MSAPKHAAPEGKQLSLRELTDGEQTFLLEILRGDRGQTLMKLKDPETQRDVTWVSPTWWLRHTYTDTDGIKYVSDPVKQLGPREGFSIEIVAQVLQAAYPEETFKPVSEKPELEAALSFYDDLGAYVRAVRRLESTRSRIKHPEKSKQVATAESDVAAEAHKLVRRYDVTVSQLDLAAALHREKINPVST